MAAEFGWNLRPVRARPSASLGRWKRGTTIAPLKTEAEVLLVDDNPAEIELMREALSSCKLHFRVNSVNGGIEALAFLHHEGKYGDSPIPDLLVLDLNLPRKDGSAVLKELKSDPELSRIPVVVFTTSQADTDIRRSYELGANSYLRKPGNLADYRVVVQSMADFWLGFATLPQKEKR
jgi:two-component system, chemotaxis family, response regulator Rcp1